jgi:hypothetical protein
MIVMRNLMSIILVLAAFTATAYAQDSNWRTYVNERFGSRIEYPANVFSPEPPPENGDGRRFKSRDAAEFTISAGYNVIPDTLQSLENSLRHPGAGNSDDYASVTYRMSKDNVLILSGFRGDNVYYDKFVFTKDQETIHHFAITYPAAAKSTYDPILERMSKSMGYAQ